MLLILLLILAYLIQRSFGWNPSVFADEWYYSKFARLLPLAESILPSYLYLWIMGATKVCGTGFLDCARIANAIAFVAAAPFIYLSACSFTSKGLAAWVAILSALLPMGSYTAFFMPEAIYYFGFCLLSWYVLTQAYTNRRLHAAVAGAMLGVLSLVKVHAVFLLPALCIYLAFVQASDKRRSHSFPHSALIVLIAAATMLLAKFGISYLLVGKAGLSLFGSFYGSTASATPDRLLLLTKAWVNGRGHAMAVAILYAVPLVILVHSLLVALIDRNVDARSLRLQVYTFLMLGSALGLSVLYTASIAAADPAEALRLHLRYYDFAFPLLLIGAASALGEARSAGHRALPWMLAAAAAAVLLMATVKLPLYRLLLVDAPEIFAIANHPWTLYTAVGFGLLMLVLWARNGQRGAALFLFVFIPATVLVSESRLGAGMHYLADESYFDTAGKFARDRIPADERNQLTVMGSNVAQLMRALFHIDAKGADFIEVPYRAPISTDQLPAGRRWVLVVDTHPIPDHLSVVARAEQYTLIELGRDDFTHGKQTVMMNAALPAGLIARVEGLSGQEPNGRWSDAKQVVFYTLQPLPKDLTLTLRAAAFGPNVGSPFTVRIGDAAASMTLGQAASVTTLDFKTDGRARTITIDVPQPTSPQSLGQSDDSRTLGLMLNSLTFKSNE